VQWFAAHDEPCPFGPVSQVHELGELRDRGAGAFVAVLALRRDPGAGVAPDPADRSVDLGVRAGHHSEADVAGTGLPHEAGAPRRVSTDLDPTGHEGRVVTGSVADGDLFGELADGLVQHGDVIGDRVGPGVAGPQQHAERLAGRVGEAVDRVEPVAALVVRRGIFLVLGVDLVQRRVDVEHHHGGAGRDRGTAPDLGADLGHRLPQTLECRMADLAEGAVQRRVRWHRSEQGALGAEVLDVRTGFAATGQHQHRLGQDLAAVMEREPLTADRDPRRERIAQPQPVRKRAKRVKTDVGHDLVAAGFHHHRNRAVTVHLASALLGWELMPSTASESLATRALPRIRDRQPLKTRERSGLGRTVVRQNPAHEAVGVLVLHPGSAAVRFNRVIVNVRPAADGQCAAGYPSEPTSP
jgi:hypothetical protein